MLKSIVAVTVLATVAAIVFGLGGVLSNAMNNGMSHIANIITNASWGRGSDAAGSALKLPKLIGRARAARPSSPRLLRRTRQRMAGRSP
jgi:hypothetical protein